MIFLQQKSRKRLTVSEVLDLVLEEENHSGVACRDYHRASRSSCESDEDSAEEEPTEGSTEHLNHFQLMANG